jgi:hypothetical protein
MHNIINKLHNGPNGETYEQNFFTDIVKNIKTNKTFNFIFTYWNVSLDEIPPDSIIFTTSDEQQSHPIANHLQKNTFLLFKNYYNSSLQMDSRVFPLPLGPIGGFEGNSNKFILERKYDYFFSGLLNSKQRIDLMNCLKNKKDNWTKFLYQSNGWAKGLSVKEYSDVMAESKIAFCPPGYLTCENYRVFEAAKSGCVLVVDKLPLNLWYYEDFPGIIVDNWSDMSFIDNLLQNKKELEELHKKTIQWYNNKVSPEAIGNFITQTIIHNTKK